MTPVCPDCSPARPRTCRGRRSRPFSARCGRRRLTRKITNSLPPAARRRKIVFPRESSTANFAAYTRRHARGDRPAVGRTVRSHVDAEHEHCYRRRLLRSPARTCDFACARRAVLNARVHLRARARAETECLPTSQQCRHYGRQYGSATPTCGAHTPKDIFRSEGTSI